MVSPAAQAVALAAAEAFSRAAAATSSSAAQVLTLAHCYNETAVLPHQPRLQYWRLTNCRPDCQCGSSTAAELPMPSSCPGARLVLMQRICCCSQALLLLAGGRQGGRGLGPAGGVSKPGRGGGGGFQQRGGGFQQRGGGGQFGSGQRGTGGVGQQEGQQRNNNPYAYRKVGLLWLASSCCVLNCRFLLKLPVCGLQGARALRRHRPRGTTRNSCWQHAQACCTCEPLLQAPNPIP